MLLIANSLDNIHLIYWMTLILVISFFFWFILVEGGGCETLENGLEEIGLS